MWHQVWLIRNILSDKNPVKALCLDLNTVQAPVLNVPADTAGVSPYGKDYSATRILFAGFLSLL